jgi:hypothetical protein
MVLMTGWSEDERAFLDALEDPDMQDNADSDTEREARTRKVERHRGWVPTFENMADQGLTTFSLALHSKVTMSSRSSAPSCPSTTSNSLS